MAELDKIKLADIENNLKLLLQPNNEVIAQATKNIDKLIKPSDASRYLFFILQGSQLPEIRQLSAILLRQKLKDHWIKLSTANRQAMKQLIIQLVVSEPVSIVKKSIAELIISISRLELSADTWRELFPFLQQLSNSQDSILIQIQLHIFEAIFDNNVPISQYIKEIHSIFERLLNSQDINVRSAAVKASGAAISSLLPPSKKKIFYGLIPLMIENIKTFIQSNMESEVIKSFEIFIDLAESITKSIEEYLPLICQLSFEIINSQLDYAYKTSAVEFLDTIIKHSPGYLQKNKYLEKVLLILYQLMTIDDDDTDENIYQAAGIAIRECGKQYKSDIVYLNAMPLLVEFQASSNPNVRKATLTIITQLSYGCKETMKDDMDKVIGFVVNGLKDQSKIVRQYACVCVGALAQNLHPDIYKYTQVIFPLIFESVTDPDNQFVLRCCYALEQFLFNLDNAVVLPIMNNILEKLFHLVSRPDIQVKEFALSTISALAVATELNFEPYFDSVLQLIQPFLTLKEKEQSALKANAFDCLSILVSTVPKEKFKQHIPALFKIAFDEVQSKPDPEVVESCFSCYSHAFERFGEEIAEYLPMVHEQILLVAQSDEAIVKHNEKQIIQGIENELNEDDEDDDIQGISIYTPLMDAKVAAIHCLSVLATNLPKSYFHNCSLVVPLIEGLSQYFHEDIRDEALTLLQAILIPINENNPSTKKWEIGDFNHVVNPNVRVLLDFSFQIYNHMLTFDTDKRIAARAFECIGKSVKLLGPASIAPYLNDIGTHLMKCFNSALHCQTINSEDTPELGEDSDDEINEDEEGNDEEDYIEDEDEDEDLCLLDLSTECLIQIAAASGPQFKVYLEAAIPILLKLTKDNVHHSMRSIVIGTIAECINVLKADFSQFFDKLYPLGIKWMKEEEDDMEQASTYLLGILIQRSVVATKAHYEEVLQSISRLLLNNSLPDEVSDNTVGCLARLLSTNISFIPNLEKVIELYFSKLPIKKEISEIEAVINSLLVLIATKPELISKYMQNIIQIFAVDLGREKLEQPVKILIVNTIKSLLQKYPNEIKQLVANLPEQHQKNLQLYLN